VLDHLVQYGTGWLEETYKYIQEDKKEHYKIMAMLMPLSRSPQSKSSAREMAKYQKDVDRQLDKLTPWASSSKFNREALKRIGVKEGEVVVLMSPRDSAEDPLYKDTRIIRRNQ
jgi:hypothetical protein